jgi:hypothetical protein
MRVSGPDSSIQQELSSMDLSIWYFNEASTLNKPKEYEHILHGIT